MPIFQTNEQSYKEVLYFCGNSQDWDNLIIKNSLAAKDVFVCDPTLSTQYPKHVKVIRSIDTAHRFLLGFGGRNSIVFINTERIMDFKNVRDLFWNRTNLLIFKMNIRQLSPLLKSGFLEISSRRSINRLRIYE